jgi:hypothetical protein
VIGVVLADADPVVARKARTIQTGRRETILAYAVIISSLRSNMKMCEDVQLPKSDDSKDMVDQDL